MHRSVPRIHTSTARGGRMGLRQRGYWTRALEGGAARVPSSCPGDERYSSRSAVRTHLPQYVYGHSKGIQGTRRVLAGYSWARAWTDLRGVLEGAVRRTRNKYAQSTSTRGVLERYRLPHGAGPLSGATASVLAATCGEGTRTAVRRCVPAHAGVLTDTSRQALARRRTARRRVRGGRTGDSAY